MGIISTQRALTLMQDPGKCSAGKFNYKPPGGGSCPVPSGGPADDDYGERCVRTMVPSGFTNMAVSSDRAPCQQALELLDNRCAQPLKTKFAAPMS